MKRTAVAPATMAQAATFTPFRSSSFAGQRVVAKSSSVARSAVLRQPVQCRTLEAGAWPAHARGPAALPPLRAAPDAVTCPICLQAWASMAPRLA